MNTKEGVETPEEPIKKLWSIGRIICAVFALVGLSGTIWMVYVMISNPFLGPRIMHMLFMMASSAVFINMSIAIPKSYHISPRITGLRFIVGAAQWALTIAFPLFLMASINSYADKRTVNIAKAELSPVIVFIDKELSQYGKLPDDILQEVKKIEGLSNVTYIFGDEQFVIQTRGSSIDIDGSTIYYISSDKEWRREHNDMIEAVATDDLKRYRKATKWNTKRTYRVNNETGQWVAYGG